MAAVQPDLSPAGWMGDPRRGAAMGRPSAETDPDALRAEIERLNQYAATARRCGEWAEADEYQEHARDLGRRLEAIESRAPVKVTLRRVRLDSGGYDSGGAYWGLGEPLFWAGTEGGELDSFFRAADRAAAVAHVRETFPNARFSEGRSKADYLDALDPFARAYIACALWSTTDESDPSGGEPLDSNYGPEDIAWPALRAMVDDCERFQASPEWRALVAAIRDGSASVRTSDAGDADGLAPGGHDFWLNRNGHGAGFWDGDWPEPHASALDRLAKSFGGVDLYVSRGRIHQ